MRIVPYEYRHNGAYGQCQRCAFKYRLDELQKEWSGLRVCKSCFDPLPDTMRTPIAYPEGLPRPNASPELPNIFIATPLSSEDGKYLVAEGSGLPIYSEGVKPVTPKDL
jgi:hypothetical protein